MQITLTKPQAGSSGWAEAMNQNLEDIETANNTNHNAIEGHLLPGEIKHNSDEIRYSPELTVTEKLNACLLKKTAITPGTKTKITYDANGLVTGGYNLSASDIPELPISKISGLSDIVNLVLVDLKAVSISARIINTNGGIRISCFTTPNVPVQSWKVIMAHNDTIFCEVTSSSNEIFINMDNFPEITTGLTLEVTVEAISGSSVNGIKYSHFYKYTETNIDLRITAVENNLSPSAIIDRLVQDENAMTEIANILQHSNTLIRKLDEYMSR